MSDTSIIWDAATGRGDWVFVPTKTLTQAVSANARMFGMGDGIAMHFPLVDAVSTLSGAPQVFGNDWQGSHLLSSLPRTNLMTYSEHLANSPISGVTATIGALTAPDGSLTMDKFVETTANSTHYLSRNVTLAVASYTWSIFAKGAGRNIRLRATGIGALVEVNLTTGAVTGTGSAGYISSSSTAVPGAAGVFRITLTLSCTSPGTQPMAKYLLSGVNTDTYTGDGVSGVYLWGEQVELGLIATSYHPSLDTFVSRSTIGTYVGSAGWLLTAAANVARMQYNPNNLNAAPKLLLESAATNQIKYASQFGQQAGGQWNLAQGGTALSPVVTPGYGTAPDGSLTAARFVFALGGGVTSSDVSYFNQTVTSTSNCTGSIWLKTNDGSTRLMWLRCSNNQIQITVTGAWTRFSVYEPSTGVDRLQLAAYGNSSSQVSDLSVWGAQLESGASATSYIPSTDTFTSRASTGTYFGSAGTMLTAATNVARMQYRPDNLAIPPTLLLEVAATNLQIYSEQIDNSTGWPSGAGSVVSANSMATLDPKGGNTADKLSASATNASHYAGAVSITSTSGVLLTHSVFLKAAEESIAIVCISGSGSYYATFNLVTGTVVAVGVTALIQPSGNGWYRCSITAAPAFNQAPYIVLRSATVTYLGDGVSGVYVWGAQVEAGSSTSSYIPTVAAAVARSADVSASSGGTRAADISSSVAGMITDYTIDGSGIVTFASPPVAGGTLTWTGNYVRSSVQQGGVLQDGEDLETAVLISLFTDRIAAPDDVIPDGTGDPRGWWGDDPLRPAGSRLWLLSRAKQTAETLARAQDYIAEALAWLIDDGVVARFDILVEWTRSSQLGAQVVAHKNDGTTMSTSFQSVWKGIA